MNIILLNSSSRTKGSLDVPVSRVAVVFGVFLSVVVAGAVWAGYQWGQGAQPTEDAQLAELEQELLQERAVLQDIRRRSESHLDALALKLGSVQARLLRLDALGERLVALGKLDKGEFDFTSEPALGGLDSSEVARSQAGDELLMGMEEVSRQLDDRSEKLAMLEEMIMDRRLRKEVIPAGRPVKKGWMSSRYGYRTDPKTGKKAWHRGMDFAGKQGSDVMAVASGVVVRSEFEKGYGHLIEIKHADGYSTLYAHNEENMVKQGEVVQRGQTIALLGSTGRSTGPHVHFEVRRNGRTVDPVKFVRSRQ